MSASLGERSEPLDTEGAGTFSSASDDEVGGLLSAIRSERSEPLDTALR